MRIPTPPAFDDGLKCRNMTMEQFVALMHSEQVTALVRDINQSYHHWHKVKHMGARLPEGMKPVELWAAVKMSRVLQYQELPLSFTADTKLRYWSPPKHNEWLHNVDQYGGGMIGTTSRYGINDGHSKRYLMSSLMEEAIASSQLEGATTTRKQAKAMLRSRRRPKDRAEKMILNNYMAILEIRELKGQQLTPEMLLQLQAVLTEGTLDDQSGSGRFRTQEDDVHVADVRTGDVIYTPPKARYIDDLLQEVCDLANRTPDVFIHPVTIAIVLHFAIGFIHPFVDGNGRTARAIFYWYMLKHGYWLFEYLPISRIFLNAPSRYARAYLYTETDQGDLTYFIHYNLRVIARAIHDLHSYLRAEQQKKSAIARAVRLFPSVNARQAEVLEDALENPRSMYDIRTHMGTHNIAYGTARSDLLGLVELGLLEKVQRGKANLFLPVDNLVDILEISRKELLGSQQVTTTDAPSPVVESRDYTSRFPLFDLLDALSQDEKSSE